jgi:hypothetical protein
VLIAARSLSLRQAPHAPQILRFFAQQISICSREEETLTDLPDKDIQKNTIPVVDSALLDHAIP